LPCAGTSPHSSIVPKWTSCLRVYADDFTPLLSRQPAAARSALRNERPDNKSRQLRGWKWIAVRGRRMASTGSRDVNADTLAGLSLESGREQGPRSASFSVTAPRGRTQMQSHQVWHCPAQQWQWGLHSTSFPPDAEETQLPWQGWVDLRAEMVAPPHP
jgi:hypothetical protein